MKISYEIIDANKNKIGEITGSELREKFGVGPNDDVFTEKLVMKFNLINECRGEPERMRQITEMDL